MDNPVQPAPQLSEKQKKFREIAECFNQSLIRGIQANDEKLAAKLREVDSKND